MAVSEELLVSVKIDTKDGTVAVKDLSVSFKDLQKAAKDGGDSVEKSGKQAASSGLKFTELNQALELAGKVYNALVGPINKVLSGFIDQEKAQSELRSTLQGLGFDTRGALKDLVDFADQLENTTGVQAETTLGLARVGKTMGLTNAETKNLVKTAMGMSNVLGTDVNSAFNDLIGQLNGATGRSAKFVDGMKNLNEAQLRAGKGIELAAAQYAKFADLSGGSLAGGIKIAQEAFNSILDEIGKIISDFVDLPTLVRESAATFREIANDVKAFGERIAILKQGLSEITFDELIAGLRALGIAFGTAFVAMNFQAVIGGLKAIRIALTATAVPAALVAAKFALIAAAVLGVVIAVETVVVNFEKLPQLAETIKLAFQNMFQRLIRGFATVGVAGLSAIETILEPLAKFSDVAASGLEKVRSGMQSLGNVMDEADKNVEDLNKQVRDTAKGLEMGPTLSLIKKGIEAVTGAFGDTKTAVDDVSDSFDDLSKKPIPGPSPEQLKLLEQLRAENAALTTELGNFGKEQIEILDSQFDLLKAQNESRLKQLEIEGKLAGPVGDQIRNSLKEQLSLQRAITDEKILQQAEQDISRMNPVAQVAGKAALEAGKGLNSLIPAINNVFGTNIEKFKASSIAAFAIGAAKFFDSFEGFMSGSAMIVGKSIEGAAAGVDKLFGTSFSKGAAGFSKAFSAGAGFFGSVLDIGAKAIAKMFDPKFIQGLADMLTNLIDQLPQMLMQAFDALADAMDKVIEKLPEIVAQLMNSMGKIFDRLIQQMPALIDALADALVTFLDKLPELTGKLFAALPGIIDKLLSRLPDIIDALFRAIPQIINQLFAAIPGIIVSILQRLPDILESLVTGIIGAMGEIVAGFIDAFLVKGGLEKIVVALIKAVPRIAIALVNGIVNGLKRAFGALFGGMKAPQFLKDVGELPKKIEKGVKELAKTASKEASKLFKVLDLESEANAVDRLKDAKKVTDVIDIAVDTFSGRVGNLWKAFLDGLKRLWDWIYNNILKWFVDALTTAWRWVWDTILKPLFEGLKSAWMFVYQNIIQPLLNGLKSIWGMLTNVVQQAWSGVLNFFQNLFKGNVEAAFSGVIDTMRGIGTTIWNGLKSGLEAGFNLFSNLGSKIWEGLWNGLSGLGDFFRNTLNSINPANLLSKMFTLDGGGRGKIEHALGIDVPFASFAQGGIVPGNPVVKGDSPLNDNVLAFLSPGEFVIPRSIMDQPGMYDFIKAIVDNELNLPQLWGGSVSVGGTSIGVGSGGVTVNGKSAGEIATDTINRIGDGARSIGDRATDLKGAIEQGGKDFWEKAQDIGQDVWDELAKLDPTKLWDRVKDIIWDSVWKMVTHSAGNFHTGGLVKGYADGGDVMATLQPGEYVMSRGAVNTFGQGFMDRLNQGSMPGQPIYNVDMKVMIEASSQSLDESFVRNRLIPSIKDEFKKASLRGEFLMSNKGLRTT